MCSNLLNQVRKFWKVEGWIQNKLRKRFRFEIYSSKKKHKHRRHVALCECEITSIYLSVNERNHSVSSYWKVFFPFCDQTRKENKWRTSIQWMKTIIHCPWEYFRETMGHDNWYALRSFLLVCDENNPGFN